MMKIQAKVQAGKTTIKESYKVTYRLNLIKLHNSYHTININSRFLLRLIAMDLDFAKSQI